MYEFFTYNKQEEKPVAGLFCYDEEITYSFETQGNYKWFVKAYDENAALIATSETRMLTIDGGIEYDINIIKDEYVQTDLSTLSAQEGETISFSISFSSVNYGLKDISFTCLGSDIPYTCNGLTYGFTMPAGDVDIVINSVELITPNFTAVIGDEQGAPQCSVSGKTAT